MNEPGILDQSIATSDAAVRKPWAAPQIIVSESRDTRNHIPFGGTPDGSLTISPGNVYKYGS